MMFIVMYVTIAVMVFISIMFYHVVSYTLPIPNHKKLKWAMFFSIVWPLSSLLFIDFWLTQVSNKLYLKITAMRSSYYVKMQPVILERQNQERLRLQLKQYNQERGRL